MNPLKRILLGALVAIQNVACVPPPVAEPVRAGAPPPRSKVLVLESQKSPLLDVAVDAFVQNIDADVQVISRVAESDIAAILKGVEAYRPDVVMTVGTPATVLARDRLSRYPVLFTLVLNQSRLNLADHGNMAGIAMEIAPLVEFTQFKMVLPQLRTVAAFYTSGQSRALVKEATRQLESIGVELVPIEVPADGDIAALYASARRADAVWILNDPIVFKQFPAILARVSQDNVPVITSFSDSFARLGALASMSVDLDAVGSQAAHMTRTLLAHRKNPAQLGVQQPNGTRLVVNSDVMRRFNIDISSDVLPFINEMVTTEKR